MENLSNMQHYKCSECQAEDSDHQSYTSHPEALICWNCRAGTKMTIADQVMAQYGMLKANDPVN